MVSTSRCQTCTHAHTHCREDCVRDRVFCVPHPLHLPSRATPTPAMLSSSRSVPSVGSRSSTGSRRLRRRRRHRPSFASAASASSRRSTGTGDAGDVYRWDKVVGESEAAVQEVVAAIQAGKPVSRLTWKKFDIIKRRAREPPRYTPGPGSYLKQEHTSAFGKQVLGGRKSHGRATLGRRHPARDVYSLPVHARGARRVKVRPKDVAYGRGRPSSRTCTACVGCGVTTCYVACC